MENVLHTKQMYIEIVGNGIFKTLFLLERKLQKKKAEHNLSSFMGPTWAHLWSVQLVW